MSVVVVMNVESAERAKPHQKTIHPFFLTAVISGLKMHPSLEILEFLNFGSCEWNVVYLFFIMSVVRNVVNVLRIAV